MSRDDGSLYSGMSASVALKEAKDAKKEVKQRKREALLPAGQIVREELQKEIDKLRIIDYVEVETMIDEPHFKAEMMARKKTVEKLMAVQARLNTILRTTDKEPDTWSQTNNR